jgi:hypothetical protein
MVGTRDLARLVAATAHANGKFVLVGDDRQLPEIQAGGLFAALADRLGALELTEIRRQGLRREARGNALVRGPAPRRHRPVHRRPPQRAEAVAKQGQPAHSRPGRASRAARAGTLARPRPARPGSTRPPGSAASDHASAA